MGERLADEALSLGQAADQPDSVLMRNSQLVFTRIAQGRVTEIRERLEEMIRAHPKRPALRAAMAWGYCWLDRYGEAAAIIDEAAVDRFEHVPWDSARSITLSMYSAAASETGRSDAATALYQLLEPSADQIVYEAIIGFGHVRLWLGLLAARLCWHDRADQHLDFACRFHDDHGVWLWAAYGQLGWAQALLSRGQPDQARDLASRALALGRAHGYVGVVARASAIVTPAASAIGR